MTTDLSGRELGARLTFTGVTAERAAGPARVGVRVTKNGPATRTDPP